jgi:hypothetical protein
MHCYQSTVNTIVQQLLPDVPDVIALADRFHAIAPNYPGIGYGLDPTKEDLLMSINGNVPAQYLGSGDPALKDYYPAWLDNMADDATVEGSMLDGAVQGAEAVQSIVRTIRSFYDRQEFKFAGPYGDNGFLEDYVAEVRGEPLGCVVLVTRNASGQTQHVVASYRPRSSLLLFSRLLAEKFAGTPIARHFTASES